MALPVQRGVAPMLARLEDEVPEGEGWLYEPKWDGFRALVYKDGDDLFIQSRNGQPLDRYFPELVESLHAALPDRCVVDGEIVISGPRGLEFETLLQRVHPAESRIRKLAKESPASFVAFDLLALDSADLRQRPLVARRAKLKAALAPHPMVHLTPASADVGDARRWLNDYDHLGLDGVVAKREEQVYVEDERVMVKVKRHQTADCVIGGYRKDKKGTGIGSVLCGLYDADGVLHYVGHFSSMNAKEKKALLAELKPLEGGESFVGGRAPGGPSRWSQGRDMSWVSVTPRLVCEVAFDRMIGGHFRHAGRFVRWRPDKTPAECTFEQLGSLRKRSAGATSLFEELAPTS